VRVANNVDVGLSCEEEKFAYRIEIPLCDFRQSLVISCPNRQTERLNTRCVCIES